MSDDQLKMGQISTRESLRAHRPTTQLVECAGAWFCIPDKLTFGAKRRLRLLGIEQAKNPDDIMPLANMFAVLVMSEDGSPLYTESEEDIAAISC